MFDLHCDGHGGPTVLSTRAIERVDQHDGRIELRLRCWCGHVIRHVTGRNGTAPEVRVLAVAPAGSVEAHEHFAARLQFETDPADVWHDLAAGEDRFVLVDVRSAEAYAEAHLPGAVSMPVTEMDPQAARMVLDQHGAEMAVVYCWRTSCNGATKGAARLASFGIPVKEMIGGIDGWRAEGLPFESGAGRGPADALVCA
jgi:rhodanese-related sulfurtransferase